MNEVYCENTERITSPIDYNTTSTTSAPSSCQLPSAECYTRLGFEPKPRLYVTYNNSLKCPELSPWLQKARIMKETGNNKRSTTRLQPRNTLYRSRIQSNKYCPPLTPTFRFYEEPECYIEEYRMYKSPGISRIDLEREYNYLTALTIDTLSSGSNPSPSASPKPKYKKSKEYRLRQKYRSGNLEESSKYLNNARVSSGGPPNSKRIAIKIPKCETKNRRTFFPVILSRYSSGCNFNQQF